MAKIPDKFDALVKIALGGEQIIIGDFSPSPVSNSWLCWISYLPNKEFAFNTSLRIDFRLRVLERIACRGSINLMEGCMHDMTRSSLSQPLIDWLKQRYQDDPIQYEKVSTLYLKSFVTLAKLISDNLKC